MDGRPPLERTARGPIIRQGGGRARAGFALASDFEALPETAGDVLDRENLVHRFLEFVLHAPEFHDLRLGIPDHEAGPRVAIARLAHRADVDIVLSAVGQLDLVGKGAGRVCPQKHACLIMEKISSIFSLS